MQYNLITGKLPLPAGEYKVSVSDGYVRVANSDSSQEIPVDNIRYVSVGWAVPAKSGGYVCLSLQLKDDSEKVLLMSEGYDADVLGAYCRTGTEIAGWLKLEFREVPLGADA